MAATRFREFTDEQAGQVLDLLDVVPDRIGYLGETLSRDGSVRELWWEEPAIILRGTVSDIRAYDLIVDFGPYSIDTVVCSCGKPTTCHHAVAMLLTALDGWRKPLPPSQQQSASSALNHSVPPSPATPAPMSWAATRPESPLLAYLRKQTGSPLGRRERELVEKIEALWKKRRSTLPENELFALGGHSGFYFNWPIPQVRLWSEEAPPQSPVECFHFVAWAMRERDRLPALPMFQTIDWAAVDVTTASLRRRQHIEKWKKELSRVANVARVEPPSIQFRLRLRPEGGVIEWRKPGAAGFVPMKPGEARRIGYSGISSRATEDGRLDEGAFRFAQAALVNNVAGPSFQKSQDEFAKALNTLLRQPGFEGMVVTPAGDPIIREPLPLQWSVRGPIIRNADQPTNPTVPASASDATILNEPHYEVVLCTAEGAEAPPPLVCLKGWPMLHVTTDRVYEVRGPLSPDSESATKMVIPAPALESDVGVEALKSLEVDLPEPIATRLQPTAIEVTVRCRLYLPPDHSPECFQVCARTTAVGPFSEERWIGGTDWLRHAPSPTPSTHEPDAPIIVADREDQMAASRWLAEAGVQFAYLNRESQDDFWGTRRLQGAALREFPETFLAWVARRPAGVVLELDQELAALKNGKVSGSLFLDIQESEVDWFDLQVSLALSDVELTAKEIDILLKAQGRWVRLPSKGWRRLEFHLSEEEKAQLADLGLAAGDLKGTETQRLHVLQLAGATASRMLPAERVAQVQRRAEELRTSVTPAPPAAVTATLRPYQLEGFHFLAYLSSNRFGGILADDMGLGKTIQTLTWLAWLRESGQLDGPSLVVCPKSVQDNWRAEVARFCPQLRVLVWSPQNAGELATPAPKASGRRARGARAAAAAPADDLVVINYAQLRIHETRLRECRWGAVILDEAQSIKNPGSLTSKAACALPATHRLALSGTPIENRLLDLWAIMNFAMPGVLGAQASFTRQFNGKDDPLARRRLAARVRPFVLRRTKKEVAKDLPDRIEEEIICDLEGPQAVLYQAELKRARSMLLKVKTSAQLDKLRFNILTSLLRLRQICCHPCLVGAGKPRDEAAKLSALFELLEPLVAEGQKVLVFSQFIEMLAIIQSECERREWPHLLLTGQSENRGALVDRFQQAEGSTIFLISLKAGGFGLNLTAASYVVLFDPWWNPAVENQAIDRTHRIGQTSKVIAYRLLVRGTIEEKIRQLQKQKSALAADILGEETFAKALTLDDFRFLLGEGEPASEGEPADAAATVVEAMALPDSV